MFVNSVLVDATDSGSGNLEISVSINGKNIPNYVQNESGARFRVKFVPEQSGIYHVHIKFNAIDIPGKILYSIEEISHTHTLSRSTGSPFTCHVYSSDFTFENYEYASIGQRTAFLIKPKVSSMFNPNLHVDIFSPTGQQIEGKIEAKSSDVYLLRFLPNEIGDYRIVFYNDAEQKTMITKFISHVYDATKIRISDLPSAVPHRLYKFTGKVFVEF